MVGVHAEAEADGLIFVGAGRVLTACHAGGKVVADDHCDAAVLVDGIQQTGHAAMGEGGVADHCNGGAQSGIGGTLGHRDACAHIHAAGQSLKRRQRSQRVAADVAKHAGVGVFVNYLAQGAVHIPVSASLAELRRTAGEVLGGAVGGAALLAEGSSHAIGGELAGARQVAGKAALHGVAFAKQCLDIFFHYGLAVFHHQQLIALVGKLLDGGGGQRILAHLEHIHAVADSLAHIIVAYAAGDDA